MSDVPAAHVSGGSGYADLGFVRVDTDREEPSRITRSRVRAGQAGSPEIVSIVQRLLDRNHGPVLVTRIESPTAAEVADVVPGARYDPAARLLVWRPAPTLGFHLAVVTAGTADVPVATEAAAVATAVGMDAALIRDVGAAGIHRLLAIAPELHTYHAVIVVAGMEAALASVVGGLVACSSSPCRPPSATAPRSRASPPFSGYSRPAAGSHRRQHRLRIWRRHGCVSTFMHPLEFAQMTNGQGRSASCSTGRA